MQSSLRIADAPKSALTNSGAIKLLAARDLVERVNDAKDLLSTVWAPSRFLTTDLRDRFDR